jgi:hypothetical protein
VETLIAIFLIVLACLIIISGPTYFLRMGRALYRGVARLFRRQHTREQRVKRQRF